VIHLDGSASASATFLSQNWCSVLYQRTQKNEIEVSLNYGLALSFQNVFRVVPMLFSRFTTGVPTLQMWQWALDELFTLALAVLQIISPHTSMLPYLICPHNDDSTPSIHLMMRVVLDFKDHHGLIWPMIVIMQKWFTIFDLLIQDRLVPCSCSTIAGGLCMIAIMISPIWDQTSVNHEFCYIDYYYDISTKPRGK